MQHDLERDEFELSSLQGQLNTVKAQQIGSVIEERAGYSCSLLRNTASRSVVG